MAYNSKIKISVAMATYNGERYLRQQLKSVFNQTHRHLELIVCDDCSTDSTWHILQRYARKYSRMRCYRNEYNLGHKENFEKAISLCKSKYIALCDQDDIWLADHLEVLMTNIGDKQVCVGKWQYIDEYGNPLDSLRVFDDKYKEYADDDNKRLKYMLYNRPFYQGSSMLIHKSLVPKIFPLPGIMMHDSWIACFCSANRSFAFADRVITLWRQHSDNISGYNRDVTTNLIHIAKEASGTETKNSRESRYEQCCELLKRLPNMDLENRNTVITAGNFYRKTGRLLFRMLYTNQFLSNIEDGFQRRPRWIWTLLRLARFWVFYK
jgi:glycosyltransferase involved in cell wall biosynthesis